MALKVFSNTGGIEQVARNWLYAFNRHKYISFKAKVLYDNFSDERYIDNNKIKCYNADKLKFVWTSVSEGVRSDVLVLSHINLSLIAVIIKILNPKVNVHVQLHGIEAWSKLSLIQSLCLKLSKSIFCVSTFTKERVNYNYPKLQPKLHVLLNTLDPIRKYEVNYELRNSKRFNLGLKDNDRLLITVSRLNSKESYKGYDKVLKAIGKINNENLFYHIIGKYDISEKNRILNIIDDSKLADRVKILGYIDDQELEEYYQAADLFIMPSKGEGFGLVYLEAMARGLRVIAGDKDGSLDAISGIENAFLVDPDSDEEIQTLIKKLVLHKFDDREKEAMKNDCLKRFNPDRLMDSINLLLAWK